MTSEIAGLPILTMLIALPLVAALACLFVKAEGGALDRACRDPCRPRASASCCGRASTPPARNGSSSRRSRLAAGIEWALGIDGIALVLIMLSVFLMPICIGASWRAITSACPNIWRPSC